MSFMVSSSHPVVRTWSLVCALAVTAVFPANASEPEALRAAQRVEAEARPHYLYQGAPVYLDVDPSRLVVSGTAGASESALRGTLSNAGLAGAILERMPLQDDAFTVRLAKQATVVEAQRLAEALRQEGRYGFVANMYQWQGGDVVLHDRLIVHLKDGADAGAIERINKEWGSRLLRGPEGGSEEYLLAYPKGADPLAFALAVGQRPEVEWVDPDKTSARQLYAVPSDPFYGQQYYANNPTRFNDIPVDIRAEWAWDLTYGSWPASAGAFLVAVVDNGVEVAHPDLGSQFVMGYDALQNTWSTWACMDCATRPSEGDSHGTFVAGIIKAQHNGMGLAGLAPHVTLLPIRIARQGGFAPDYQIAMGLDAAWQNGAQVISNSWGGGSVSNAITAAIDRATSKGRNGRGAVVVFAGGNTSNRLQGQIGAVAYPARLPNVLAVGAINRQGGPTNYGPRGPELDVVAPSSQFIGECRGDVMTIDLLDAWGCNDGPGGDINYSSSFGGTSAAAPQAAAVAAMVIARSPLLTEAEVRQRIKSGADGWDPANQMDAGKLNAFRALVGRASVTVDGPVLPPTADIYSYTANVTGGVVGANTYYWTLTDMQGQHFPLGTDATVSVEVRANESFQLSVMITNGPDGQVARSGLWVRGPTTCAQGPITPGNQCPIFD
ncbi:S8 family serine peptidase [Corallococcus aberystwythensis]|uniref:Peptidase S8/S53 domain-containing protein n=1 Tax=Corallococcus aberystwythensis TaxID=2316722 RepID=A0A3A8QD40_9BACT|nr:S8 family serine peptidase [Corallococcus aberystwythensis]RKH66546.1 hypothetical protein D7W81_15280 [Corallococcus aberystwythensis]